MNTDVMKQKARLAILEKLKQAGMPSPSKEAAEKLGVPSSTEEQDQPGSVKRSSSSPSGDTPEESESMNDIGLDKQDEQRMLGGIKKKKGPSALVQKLNSLLGR